MNLSFTQSVRTVESLGDPRCASRSQPSIKAMVALLASTVVGGLAGCGVPGNESAAGNDSAPQQTTVPPVDPSEDSNDVADPGDQADGGRDDPSANGDTDIVPEENDDPNGDAVTTDAALRGYWVWEQRVQGTEVQAGDVDRGQMKVAFGEGNQKCHYIWNETTRSDFHTDCTYSVDGDMIRFDATADPDGTAAGYSCAHPDWTNWNDRPAVQWGRYRVVGDRLWIGVNTYWGFGGGVAGVPSNGSLKRFPFWESEGQAATLESWIVFRPVTREEWYTTYAISTRCQGGDDVCAQWPGCGEGDQSYVD